MRPSPPSLEEIVTDLSDAKEDDVVFMSMATRNEEGKLFDL